VDHLGGTVWIDAADHVTTKLVAHLVPAEGRREPVFVQAYERTADGLWLGSYTRLNPSVKPAFFNGEAYDWIVVSHNYRRFSIDATEVKQPEPKRRTG